MSAAEGFALTGLVFIGAALICAVMAGSDIYGETLWGPVGIVCLIVSAPLFIIAIWTAVGA